MNNGPDAHLGTWLTVGVLIGVALALLVGVLAVGVLRARRAAGARAQPAAPAPATAPAQPVLDPGPAFAEDDLPGFAEQPPGWTPGPRTAPAAPGAAGTPAPLPTDDTTGRPGHAPTDLGRGGTTAVAAAVLFLLAAIVVAYAAGGGTASARSQDASPAVTAAPTESSPAAQPAPPSATGTAAAALAFKSVPLGEAGVAASVTFQGVVLEQRAVGLTVTYPSVSVSTDGRRALAHVRLPTFNCLTAEPPTDPVAAGCTGSVTEYADLADPQLQVSRDGDRLDLAGLFPTYTRSNGSAPGYTGRAYQLTVSLTADGPTRDGAAPAAGTIRIGLDSARTTGDRGVNLLQFPG